MLIRKSPTISESEVTPYELYLNRRKFIGQAGRIALMAAVAPSALAASNLMSEEDGATVIGAQEDELTPYEHVTEYNNFYEFGTGKADPARNAGEWVSTCLVPRYSLTM